MIFGKRYKHKLPTFPAEVAPTFQNLCEAVDAGLIPQLQEELGKFVREFEEGAENNQRIDLRLVKQLEQCSRALLERYIDLTEEQRALAIGAIRYFVITDDALPDEGFASGLDDDVAVMNYVLEQLGVEGMFIRIDFEEIE